MPFFQKNKLYIIANLAARPTLDAKLLFRKFRVHLAQKIGPPWIRFW